MVMTYESHRLRTFSDICERYTNTKPIKSVYHSKADDIRPIADRKRKGERIWKVSDTQFALMDGENDFHLTSSWTQFAVKNNMFSPATEHQALMLAPIVWTRDEDETETVRVRNGSGPFGHNTRYSFLQRFLPHGLKFSCGNGKQFVHGQFLPKSCTLPEELTHPHTFKSFGDVLQREDDHKYLTFQRYIETPSFYSWKVIGNTFTPPKRLVNTEEKAKYKADIDKFWQFVCTMVIMLPTGDWQYYRQMVNELRQGHNYKKAQEGRLFNHSEIAPPPAAYLEILCDDEHDMRVNMGVEFAHTSRIHEVSDKEDLKVLRAKFNSYINKCCGFTYQTDEGTDK